MTSFQNAAVDIVDAIISTISSQVSFVNKEVILSYPKGRRLLDEAIIHVRKVLELKFGNRPRVVCLCGSTRFFNEFQEANFFETMAGRVVLSVGCMKERKEITPEQKSKLDLLHLKKIDMADEILVINVDNYVGESTNNEINYARQTDKKIRWWTYERLHG